MNTKKLIRLFMNAFETKDLVTVEGVIDWASQNGIDLGRNPKRMLVYLATNGIIPKTIKGKNCKGVYRKSEIFDRLSFYYNRRREGWRIQDIAVAVIRLQNAQKESLGADISLKGVLQYQTDEELLSLPYIDLFKYVFREYIRRNPEGAENLVQYLDEQESLTGVKIGQAFRRAVGMELVRRMTNVQARIDF